MDIFHLPCIGTGRMSCQLSLTASLKNLFSGVKCFLTPQSNFELKSLIYSVSSRTARDGHYTNWPIWYNDSIFQPLDIVYQLLFLHSLVLNV